MYEQSYNDYWKTNPMVHFEHENKKAFRLFYHQKIFDRKWRNVTKYAVFNNYFLKWN